MHTIRPMTAADAGPVLEIYQAGIDGRLATFETEAPSWEEFDARRMPDHRLVAVDGVGVDGGGGAGGGAVLGWAACIPYSWRDAYRGVVEHGVYVHPSARGRQIGISLMRALIASTEAAGIWCVQSGVFRENTASLALHRKAGFREIGYRERVGCLHGVWHDVILVERRSRIVG
jgi:L-amino acid N-acyltransferase YncA